MACDDIGTIKKMRIELDDLFERVESIEKGLDSNPEKNSKDVVALSKEVKLEKEGLGLLNHRLLRLERINGLI